MNADTFTYSKEPYYQKSLFDLLGFSHSKLCEEKKIRLILESLYWKNKKN